MKDNLTCYTQGHQCTFRKILDQFGWFVTADGKWNVMPQITADTGERFRVNYCPSCGQNIRDVIIAAPNEEEGYRGCGEW